MDAPRWAPVLLCLLAPAGATAQTCGPAPGVQLAGGYVDYRVAGGTSGAAAGLDAAFAAGPAAVRIGYRHLLLAGDGANPDAVRAMASFPALEMEGIRLCGDAHAGFSRFARGGDDSVVLTAGLGATLTPAEPGRFRPYISVRGLGAQSVGTVLGVDIGAGGLAVGVEAGVEGSRGPLSFRLAVSRDGFDDGLGVTPFPRTAVELAVGYLF